MSGQPKAWFMPNRESAVFIVGDRGHPQIVRLDDRAAGHRRVQQQVAAQLRRRRNRYGRLLR